MSTSPAGAGREPLGSAAEEAARLAEAVHAWWDGRGRDEPTGPSAESAAPAGEPAGDPVGDPAQDPAQDPAAGTCRYCPLCRGVAAVHAVRPEVLTHLLAAAESVAAALRELARQSDAAPARPHADRPAAPGDRPRSVRIPVDDGEQVGPGRAGSQDDESQEGH